MWQKTSPCSQGKTFQWFKNYRAEFAGLTVADWSTPQQLQQKYWMHVSSILIFGRGGNSIFINVKNTVRLCCWLPNQFKQQHTDPMLLFPCCWTFLVCHGSNLPNLHSSSVKTQTGMHKRDYQCFFSSVSFHSSGNVLVEKRPSLWWIREMQLIMPSVP